MRTSTLLFKVAILSFLVAICSSSCIHDELNIQLEVVPDDLVTRQPRQLEEANSSSQPQVGAVAPEDQGQDEKPIDAPADDKQPPEETEIIETAPLDTAGVQKDDNDVNDDYVPQVERPQFGEEVNDDYVPEVLPPRYDDEVNDDDVPQVEVPKDDEDINVEDPGKLEVSPPNDDDVNGDEEAPVEVPQDDDDVNEDDGNISDQDTPVETVDVPADDGDDYGNISDQETPVDTVDLPEDDGNDGNISDQDVPLDSVDLPEDDGEVNEEPFDEAVDVNFQPDDIPTDGNQDPNGVEDIPDAKADDLPDDDDVDVGFSIDVPADDQPADAGIIEEGQEGNGEDGEDEEDGEDINLGDENNGNVYVAIDARPDDVPDDESAPLYDSEGEIDTSTIEVIKPEANSANMKSVGFSLVLVVLAVLAL